MAVLSPTQVVIAKIAGLLGMVQGLAWIGMSLACIILYLSETIIFDDENDLSYMETLQKSWYFYYLTDHWDANYDQVVTPKCFHAFMWIFFLENVMWCIVSAFLIYGVRHHPNNKNELLMIIKRWSYLTFIIFTLDIIFTILLGAEHDACLSISNDNVITVQATCTNMIIPLLLIAAKGFVLLIVNGIFGYLMFNTVTSISSLGNNMTSGVPGLVPVQHAYTNAPSVHQNYPQQQQQQQQRPYYDNRAGSTTMSLEDRTYDVRY